MSAERCAPWSPFSPGWWSGGRERSPQRASVWRHKVAGAATYVYSLPGFTHKKRAFSVVGEGIEIFCLFAHTTTRLKSPPTMSNAPKRLSTSQIHPFHQPHHLLLWSEASIRGWRWLHDNWIRFVSIFSAKTTRKFWILVAQTSIRWDPLRRSWLVRRPASLSSVAEEFHGRWFHSLESYECVDADYGRDFECGFFVTTTKATICFRYQLCVRSHHDNLGNSPHGCRRRGDSTHNSCNLEQRRYILW